MTFGSEALSHKARSHGPRWRTAHASSVDEKYIYIIPRQLPPRLLPVLLYIECPQIIVLLIGIVTDHLRVVYPCFFC